MEIIFKSVLKDEFASYMKLVKLSVKEYMAYRRTLSGFDSFLHVEGLAEKKLDAEMISRWLDGSNVKPLTKKRRLSNVRRFASYLRSLGVKACIPELPRMPSNFMPYVFTKDEMMRIFDAVDDLILTNPDSRIAAEFPMLLRILYGCGLRLGEAISLTWDDINLDAGVITIRIAKNDKPRIVPMGDELIRILKLYSMDFHETSQS